MIVYQKNLFSYFAKKLNKNILIIKKFLQFQAQIFSTKRLKMIFSFQNIIIVGVGLAGEEHGNIMIISLHSGPNGNILNSGNIYMIT